jgi:Reverse transcriptase (RNA-dependent DNA polymerase)
MPFELTNAPATFQALMNDIFRALLDECVVVYLDDILVYSNKCRGSIYVQTVLQQLKEHKLYLKLSKWSFFKTEIEDLGHIVSPGKIQSNPSLVKAIRQSPCPESIKSLQSFLGLANYYRKLVPNYSEIVVPLTDVLKSRRSTRTVIWFREMEVVVMVVASCWEFSSTAWGLTESPMWSVTS